jgi:hypothetical protein
MKIQSNTQITQQEASATQPRQAQNSQVCTIDDKVRDGDEEARRLLQGPVGADHCHY